MSQRTTNLIIAAGTSVSTSADILSRAVMSFITPAAWDAATISVEVSVDNITWVPTLYDQYGGQIGVYLTPTTNSSYAMPTSELMAYRYIRLRSGTSASPVNQTADRVLTLALLDQ